MCRTLNFLIDHPECARRLADEVKSAYPDARTRLSYDKVHALPYLDAVLHESMRLRPIVAEGMERVIPKEGTILGNYFIPGGVSAALTATVF